MNILTIENKIINTDMLTEEVNFAVLSFRDTKQPDFYFDRKVEYLEEFVSASITLRIGPFEVVMPLHWSIMCTDHEYLQSVPLTEVSGRNFSVFCLNPLDGYRPHDMEMKTGMIFPTSTWTSPPVFDKDMYVVPLGTLETPGEQVTHGPLCAIFSPSKIEVYRPISDFW